MNNRQIKKLAKNCIKAGPAIAYDQNGNGYLAYVCFVRVGMKYGVMVVDKDIAELNDTTVTFIETEIKFVLECIHSQPLNTIKEAA